MKNGRGIGVLIFVWHLRAEKDDGGYSGRMHLALVKVSVRISEKSSFMPMASGTHQVCIACVLGVFGFVWAPPL